MMSRFGDRRLPKTERRLFLSEPETSFGVEPQFTLHCEGVGRIACSA
jgi:hypothetical protein